VLELRIPRKIRLCFCLPLCNVADRKKKDVIAKTFQKETNAAMVFNSKESIKE